eukprot:358980_1
MASSRFVLMVEILVLLIGVTYGSTKSLENQQCSNSSSKIAMIGAGVSTLYLALRLYEKYGIKNIDIYEQEENAGYTLEAIDTNSEWGFLDVATIGTPVIYNDDTIHFGMTEKFKSLITRYDSIISTPLPSIKGMHHEKQSLIPMLSFMSNGVIQNYTQLVEQVIDLLLLLEEIRQKNITKISQYYEHGYTVKGESIQEWGIRNGFGNAVYFCAALCQIFLFQNDWAAQSASYQLYYYAKWRVPFIVEGLRFIGRNSTYFADLGEEYHFIFKLMQYHEIHNPGFDSMIEPSFQHLFDNVVQELTEYDIKIMFRHKALSVKKIKGKRNLEVIYKETDEINIKSKTYDFVFLSCRSQNVLKLLDKHEFQTQFDLFEKYTSMRLLNAVYIKNTQNLTVPSFWEDGGFAIYPLMFDAGKINNSFDECSPNFIYIFDDQKQFVSYGMGPTVLSAASDSFNVDKFKNDCVNKFVSYYNQFYGLNVNKEDISQIFSWFHYSEITTEGERNNFYQRIKELQGKNGLFIIGETVSGITVPNVVSYIEDNLEEFNVIMTEMY